MNLEDLTDFPALRLGYDRLSVERGRVGELRARGLLQEGDFVGRADVLEDDIAVAVELRRLGRADRRVIAPFAMDDGILPRPHFGFGGVARGVEVLHRTSPFLFC